VAEIGAGLCVLLAAGGSDGPEHAERLARRLSELRVFDDEQGRLSRSVRDVGGAVLAVPQFTLYGDVRRGRRPDFTHAAPRDRGRALFELFCGALRAADVAVAPGRFGARMTVQLECDGPVTLVISTDGWAEAQA
jgi:D-tyrosyl-tRNA(Tyr) deacylase